VEKVEKVNYVGSCGVGRVDRTPHISDAWLRR
jgi:hypothetical protein